MAAELKVIFEGLGNIKKKIEDGFKSGVKIQSDKKGEPPAPNFKYMGKSMEMLNNRIRTMSKSLYSNNSKIDKWMGTIENLQKLQKSIISGTPGSKERTKQINERIEKYQDKILSLTEKGHKVQLQQQSAIDAMLLMEDKNPIGEQTINSITQQIKILEDIRNNLSNIEEINKVNTKIGEQKEKLDTLNGVSTKKSGKGAGVMGLGVIMGGMIGLMTQLVQSTKSIQTILQFIGGLIDALVGPLLPIIIGLMKPLFILLMFLGGFLLKFFMDPVTALKELFDGIVDGIKNIFGVGGTEKQKTAVNGVGAIAGGVIGGSVGGLPGAAIGALIGPKIMEWGISFVHMLLDFGAFLGEKLADFVLWAWDMLKSGWESVKDWAGNIWNIIKNSFISLGDLLDKTWDDFITIIEDSFSSLWELLSGFGTWFWETIKNAFTTTWDLISGFGNWIWDEMTGILSTSLNVLSTIGSWIKEQIMKIWEGTKSIGSKIWSGAKSIVGVNDAVIAPGGKIISTSPQDYLIATKNPQSLMGGNGNNITINLTVNGNADRNMIDDIVRKLRKELNSRGAF